MSIADVVRRQKDIAQGRLTRIKDLPSHAIYSICNLRGGIGKTTLTVNLAYAAKEILVTDTCPQGNTSAFFDSNHYTNNAVTILDALMPYLIPGLGRATRIALNVGATNPSYGKKHNVFYIPSNEQLYLLPNQISSALTQAISIANASQRTIAITSILNSLKAEVVREMKELKISKSLIDTSPFFSGATHLSWHAADALIIPVRTDQQSINSLNMLLKLLSDPAGEFQKYCRYGQGLSVPKIQMVVITHCGWSTVSGAQNEPNAPTKIYLEKVYDIVRKNIQHFTTDDPRNHVFALDDLLGSGRFSSATSRPIETLETGESVYINRVKVTVNNAVEKCKKQLKFLNNCLW
ncbi:MAG: ATPase [Bdellovibrionales bacterium GWA2_49_15]|nr:MAG: ATPase [Bdellovibrionales bacterium GWA2_49_15]HAZ12486.1 ATPase [Bdellovibrionales bacterium]